MAKRNLGPLSQAAIRCSICGEDIQPTKSGWREGNNAEPINDGRCCDVCNPSVVVPRRFSDMFRKEIKRHRK